MSLCGGYIKTKQFVDYLKKYHASLIARVVIDMVMITITYLICSARITLISSPRKFLATSLPSGEKRKLVGIELTL